MVPIAHKQIASNIPDVVNEVNPIKKVEPILVTIKPPHAPLSGTLTPPTSPASTENLAIDNNDFFDRAKSLIQLKKMRKEKKKGMAVDEKLFRQLKRLLRRKKNKKTTQTPTTKVSTTKKTTRKTTTPKKTTRKPRTTKKTTPKPTTAKKTTRKPRTTRTTTPKPTKTKKPTRKPRTTERTTPQPTTPKPSEKPTTAGSVNPTFCKNAGVVCNRCSECGVAGFCYGNNQNPGEIRCVCNYGFTGDNAVFLPETEGVLSNIIIADSCSRACSYTHNNRK